jgi:predicted lysophospholipase L1 biosynthesis ABC-type transport system permease subunit
MLFTLGLSLATSLLFGLIPARHASRLTLVPLLRSGGTTSAAPARAFHPTSLLVIGQVAVSLVLIVLAGLMFRSLTAARDIDTGFEVDRLGNVWIELGFGLILGGIGSVVLGRLVEPVLYVPAFDPISLSIGVVVLLVAGVLASIAPMRRATAIDPMAVLRQE